MNIPEGNVIEIKRQGAINWNSSNLKCQVAVVGTFAGSNTYPYNQLQAEYPNGDLAPTYDPDWCSCINDADVGINDNACGGEDDIRLVVPAGANYFLVGIPDGDIADNAIPSSGDGCVQMQVTITDMGTKSAHQRRYSGGHRHGLLRTTVRTLAMSSVPICA